MSPSDLSLVLDLVLPAAFVAGVGGSIFWRGVELALSILGDVVYAFDQRRSRIAHARMRNVHGPLLLPDASRWVSRSAIAAALRRRYEAEHG